MFKRVKYVPLASFWCFNSKLLTYFTPCFSVSIVNFEQLNGGREQCKAMDRHTLKSFVVLCICRQAKK